MRNRLCTRDEAIQAIQSGSVLLLAGEGDVLRSLPTGNWIGGTIPYFIDAEGAVFDREHVFVTELPVEPSAAEIALYDELTIDRIVVDADPNALTILILPAFSPIHEAYAKGAPDFEDMYMRPLVGWVAGVSLEELGTRVPEVFHGPSGLASSLQGVAVHARFPITAHPQVGMLNVFLPGDGPHIVSECTDFEITECTINGERTNLARYITENRVDTRLPLVANYRGAFINTSIAKVDAEAGRVRLYAPVFAGVPYRFAHELEDYKRDFEEQLPEQVSPIFACNCVLNYLYGELEGKKLGGIRGPMTFGEIAYLLLNQTLVYVELGEAA